MTSIHLTRHRLRDGRAVLIATDRLADDELRRFKEGEAVKCKVTADRNPKFHRLFFAVINLVFEAQDTWATTEGLLDALKIAVGHCDERRSVTGTTFYVPRSISFDSMDQKAFHEFFSHVIQIIVTRILPNVQRSDLEQRLYDMLGEAGPAGIR